jgi:hypothetical protein
LVDGGLLRFALERLGDPAMIAQPVNRPLPLQQRLPHQGVREAEPPWPLRQPVEQVRPHRLVQQPEDPFRLGTAGPGRELSCEASAHQRRQLQRPARCNAQPVKPPLQHLADPSRQTQRLLGTRRPSSRQASLRPEHPNQLGGEERVPAGGVVDPSGQGSSRWPPDDGGQVSGELRLIQPSQSDPSGLRPAGQIGERGGDGPIRCHLPLTDGHHKQHRITLEFTQQVAKQQQRGRVRPMRIIQHDHQATLARGGPQERRRRVEQPEAGLPAVRGDPAGWGSGGPHPFVRSPQLRQHPKQRCRRALQSLPIGRIRPNELIPDDLDPGPKGGHSLAFGSPAPPHRYSQGFRLPGQPNGKRRLADTRFSGNDNGPTRSTKSLSQGGPQLPKLRPPPDEGNARRGDTHRHECSFPAWIVMGRPR